MLSGQNSQSPVLRGKKPHIGEGRIVYAIGDVHGCLDRLYQIVEMIRSDASQRPANWRKIVVLLGDYIDRGPHSKQVIDFILEHIYPDFEVVPLIGNHEMMMLQFLTDAANGQIWRRNGGVETLRSYGVPANDEPMSAAEFERLRDLFERSVPDNHRAFFDRLHLSAIVGDYIFVHAGLRPGVPFDQQRENDLLWIRNPFLNSGKTFGKIVVHGHTPNPFIQVRKNRIGIDTGAYFTGSLTCAAIWGNEFCFFQTRADVAKPHSGRGTAKSAHDGAMHSRAKQSKLSFSIRSNIF